MANNANNALNGVFTTYICIINHHHPEQSLEESVSVTLRHSTQTYPLTLSIFTGVISSLEFDTLCATVTVNTKTSRQSANASFELCNKCAWKNISYFTLEYLKAIK